MAKKRGRLSPLAVVILVLVIGGAVALMSYQYYLRRDEIPELSYPDLDGQRNAGVTNRQQGDVHVRPFVSSDLDSTAPAPFVDTTGWLPLSGDSPVQLGTVFQLAGKSQVEVMTAGNWLIALNGEGQFIFEDARKDEKATRHSHYWHVKKGTFRAKSHDYDPSDHWLKVITPTALIYLHKGELGMRINEGGGGQLWLVKGTVTVRWTDGRRKVLTEKGVEPL